MKTDRGLSSGMDRPSRYGRWLDSSSIARVLHPSSARPSRASTDCPLLSKQAHFGWLLDHTRRQDDGHITRTWLIVDKNRHGREGDIPIEIDYRTHRIRQGLPDEERFWP